MVTPASFLILILLQSYQCQSRATGDKSSACGSRGFYCPHTSKCIARRLRCPSKNEKIWKKALSLCSKQPYCQPLYSAQTISALLSQRGKSSSQIFNRTQLLLGDRFFVLTALSPIYRTGSRSRRGIVEDVWRTVVNDPWMHSFVQYRGFVYEYGTYGVKALDINDPNYKYNREWSSDWRRVGTSDCKYKHIRLFVKEWKNKRATYSRYSNNCHSFTTALVGYLKDDCRNLTKFFG